MYSNNVQGVGLRFHEPRYNILLNEHDHSWIIWLLFSFTVGGHDMRPVPVEWGLCVKNGKSVLLHEQIEHFTSFNLASGSSILDNSFQNYFILEKQLSTPIVLRK
jgi:hypothetical protein